MRLGVFETAAQLPSDIEKIPNRKSLFARQHGGNAIALYIFHGRAELAFDFTCSHHVGDVRTAQNLGGLGLRQQSLFKRRRVLPERAQLDGLQGNRLSAFKVVRLVNRAGWRFRQFVKDFEVADFRRHLFFPAPRHLEPLAAPPTMLDGRRPMECVWLGYLRRCQPSSYQGKRGTRCRRVPRVDTGSPLKALVWLSRQSAA